MDRASSAASRNCLNVHGLRACAITWARPRDWHATCTVDPRIPRVLRWRLSHETERHRLVDRRSRPGVRAVAGRGSRKSEGEHRSRHRLRQPALRIAPRLRQLRQASSRPRAGGRRAGSPGAGRGRAALREPRWSTCPLAPIVYAPPAFTYVYEQQWVPPGLPDADHRYDHCGRAITQQVCVAQGYYRTLRYRLYGNGAKVFDGYV
jgi:hypothetical protein